MKSPKQIKTFRIWFKAYITKNYGRKCGHIGKDEISLDCIVCKHWLAYELINWVNEHNRDLEKFGKIKNERKTRKHNRAMSNKLNNPEMKATTQEGKEIDIKESLTEEGLEYLKENGKLPPTY